MMTYYGYGYYGEGDEVYRATITGLRISPVDGTAFLDACAALVPYADGKHKVEIYSGTYMAMAYIKAAGSAETLSGIELIANGTDWTGGPPPTGWTELRCTLAALPDSGPGGVGDSCLQLTTVSDVNQAAYRTAGATTVIGTLYKGSNYIKSGTSGNESTSLKIVTQTTSTVLGLTTSTTSASWVQKSVYGTAIATTSNLLMYKESSTSGTMLFDSPSLQAVRTPSATGVTLVSAREGDQYNFTYKHASFPYNQASYTVIVKKVR